MPLTSDTILCLIPANLGNLLAVSWLMFKIGNDIAQLYDAHYRNTIVPLDLLDGRKITLSLFLSIDGDQHTNRLCR